MWNPEYLSGAHRDLVALANYVPVDDWLFTRRCILVASAGRLKQQLTTVEWLNAQGYGEEISAISRMMAEIVISAIYLQYAEEQELSRFLKFDTLKINAWVAATSERLGNTEAAQASHTKVVELEAATDRRSRDLSWSKRSLQGRAAYVDREMGEELNESLLRIVSAVGHFSVHGTFVSLHRFLPPAYRKGSLVGNGQWRPEEVAVSAVGVFRTHCSRLLKEDVARVQAVAANVIVE